MSQNTSSFRKLSRTVPQAPAVRNSGRGLVFHQLRMCFSRGRGTGEASFAFLRLRELHPPAGRRNKSPRPRAPRLAVMPSLPGPPMTLGNMRELGVRSLIVTCELCYHEVSKIVTIA